MSKRRLYTLMKDRIYTNCNNTGDKYTKLKTEEKIPRHLLFPELYDIMYYIL